MLTWCSFTFTVSRLGGGGEGSRCHPGAASRPRIVVPCPLLEDNEGMWCHRLLGLYGVCIKNQPTEKLCLHPIK